MSRQNIHGALLGLSVLLMAQSLAKANPYNGVQPCRYKADNGNVYTANQTFANCAWLAGEATYCAANHKTSANNEYDHAHVGAGFPFQDTQRNEQVTQTKANNGYDADFAGWTRQNGATFETNCHSYTFGYATLIVSTANGASRVRTDEGWTTPITEPVANCIEFTQNHSQKVTAIYDLCIDKVQTRSKKDNASGIYDITYDSPGVDGANLFKK